MTLLNQMAWNALSDNYTIKSLIQVITLLLLWCHCSNMYSNVLLWETLYLTVLLGQIKPNQSDKPDRPAHFCPSMDFLAPSTVTLSISDWRTPGVWLDPHRQNLMVIWRTTLSDSLSCLIEQHVTSLYSPGRTASGVITNYTEELSQVLFDLRSDKHLVFELLPCAPSSFTATHQTALSRPHRQQ